MQTENIHWITIWSCTKVYTGIQSYRFCILIVHFYQASLGHDRLSFGFLFRLESVDRVASGGAYIDVIALSTEQY